MTETAETSHEESSWGLFGWLTIFFIVGNLVFANLFLQFMGFIGVPVGIGVSGSLTLMVFFILRLRNGTP